MGVASSHHEPLDKSSNRMSSFRRAASFRHSKGHRGSPRKMDKIRRSFRDSFRRKKDTGSSQISEIAKPHLWQADEIDVRAGNCFFHVKYLGCVEVFESRGMQVCEEALKVLKNSRRRPVKAVLHVSGDGLRVVEDDTKGLIVDQTIEKVSFCAPDRNHERGFSYICRDGTTRRWMCHGFLAFKESGERLSHAVGCAFAVCLERKQKRDKQCAVTMNFDVPSSTFTRTGSFKQASITDQLTKTESSTEPSPVTSPTSIPISINNTNKSINTSNTIITNINNNNEKWKLRDIGRVSTISHNVHAIERPHATVSMLERQGSFRGLSHLNHASPFKRQLSLRVNQLPSNLERTRSHSLHNTRIANLVSPLATEPREKPEISPVLSNGANADQVAAMCQQLSFGLSLLSQNDGTSNVLENLNENLDTIESIDKKRMINNINKDLDHSFLANIDAIRLTTVNGDEDEGIKNDDVKSTSDLPLPDQWLGKVAQLTLKSPTVTPPSKSMTRAYSMGSAPEMFYNKNNDKQIINVPFDDSTLPDNNYYIKANNIKLPPQPPPLPVKLNNTNPFLPTTETVIDNNRNNFEVQI